MQFLIGFYLSKRKKILIIRIETEKESFFKTKLTYKGERKYV